MTFQDLYTPWIICSDAADLLDLPSITTHTIFNRVLSLIFINRRQMGFRPPTPDDILRSCHRIFVTLRCRRRAVLCSDTLQRYHSNTETRQQVRRGKSTVKLDDWHSEERKLTPTFLTFDFLTSNKMGDHWSVLVMHYPPANLGSDVSNGFNRASA